MHLATSKVVAQMCQLKFMSLHLVKVALYRFPLSQISLNLFGWKRTRSNCNFPYIQMETVSFDSYAWFFLLLQQKLQIDTVWWFMYSQISKHLIAIIKIAFYNFSGWKMRVLSFFLSPYSKAHFSLNSLLVEPFERNHERAKSKREKSIDHFCVCANTKMFRFCALCMRTKSFPFWCLLDMQKESNGQDEQPAPSRSYDVRWKTKRKQWFGSSTPKEWRKNCSLQFLPAAVCAVCDHKLGKWLDLFRFWKYVSVRARSRKIQTTAIMHQLIPCIWYDLTA